jgi:hypothetical protein
MAGARMIGMPVRDHSLVHRPYRIDVESADLAAHAGGCGDKNIFGAHAG